MRTNARRRKTWLALSIAGPILDFGKHFTVIAPDSRGQGGSSDNGDTLSYHVMAEAIVALLDHLRIARADAAQAAGFSAPESRPGSSRATERFTSMIVESPG